MALSQLSQTNLTEDQQRRMAEHPQIKVCKAIISEKAGECITANGAFTCFSCRNLRHFFQLLQMFITNLNNYIN